MICKRTDHCSSSGPTCAITYVNAYRWPLSVVDPIGLTCIQRRMVPRKRIVGYRLTLAAAALLSCSHALGEGRVVWSPDHKLYAVSTPGERDGQGQERERLEVFTEDGRKIAVAHVWLVEPDGTYRAGIRGCESWGWVDSARLFCQGSASPSVGIYLLFDARSGRELGEFTGTGFVWSPDLSLLASIGDARDLGVVAEESDSIEVQGKPLYPTEKDTQPHWFRSPLTWSPDGRYLGVVDNRPNQQSLYLVVVGIGGRRFEQRLRWPGQAQDYPPVQDFSVHWAGKEVVVEHAGTTQSVAVVL